VLKQLNLFLILSLMLVGSPQQVCCNQNYTRGANARQQVPLWEIARQYEPEPFESNSRRLRHQALLAKTLHQKACARMAARKFADCTSLCIKADKEYAKCLDLARHDENSLNSIAGNKQRLLQMKKFAAECHANNDCVPHRAPIPDIE
jgi:hypothetical protein